MDTLSHSLTSGVVQTAVLLTVCVIVEQVAVIERYSLKQRVPGVIFQNLGLVLGTTLSWSLQQAWQALGIGNVVVLPLFRWLHALPLGSLIYFFVMFAITDFLIYWRHRAEHRFFWPIHAVHHAPRELHAANDIGHPFQCIPDLLVVWLPLSLVQMPGPATPVAVGLLTSFLTMYIHSPIDFHFGPFRRVVVDNRFHRIHHSVDPKHIDHNFSVALSIWDWMFGTAYWPEDNEWPNVGVTGLPAPRTAREFLLMPLRRELFSGGSDSTLQRPERADEDSDLLHHHAG